MNWLMHNVVADLYGPYFLLFYAAAIAAVVASSYSAVRRLDRTRHLPPQQIPAKLDPYEIAYLRGGERGGRAGGSCIVDPARGAGKY